jgi:hypothetical protein
MGLGKKLIGGAVGVVSAAASVVRHIAWYVSHHSGGDRG